jgi:hypothetical protein
MSLSGVCSRSCGHGRAAEQRPGAWTERTRLRVLGCFLLTGLWSLDRLWRVGKGATLRACQHGVVVGNSRSSVCEGISQGLCWASGVFRQFSLCCALTQLKPEGDTKMVLGAWPESWAHSLCPVPAGSVV